MSITDPFCDERESLETKGNKSGRVAGAVSEPGRATNT
jgi:hypothetical protein